MKASSLLRILAKEAFSATTFRLTDLLMGLGKLIVRFSKACAKGFTGFIKFIEELLQGTKNGAKAKQIILKPLEFLKSKNVNAGLSIEILQKK